MCLDFDFCICYRSNYIYWYSSSNAIFTNICTYLLQAFIYLIAQLSASFTHMKVWNYPGHTTRRWLHTRLNNSIWIEFYLWTQRQYFIYFRYQRQADNNTSVNSIETMFWALPLLLIRAWRVANFQATEGNKSLRNLTRWKTVNKENIYNMLK